MNISEYNIYFKVKGKKQKIIGNKATNVSFTFYFLSILL